MADGLNSRPIEWYPASLAPPAERGMLVQPQRAATVCELDLVQHAIRSWKRAQTLDSKQRPENCHEPLNLTLDCEYAHVSSHSPDASCVDGPRPARDFVARGAVVACSHVSGPLVQSG